MDEDELRALAAEAGEDYESVRQELDTLRHDAELVRQHVLPPPREIRQLADSIRTDLILSVAREVAEGMGADVRYVLSTVAKFSGFPATLPSASVQTLAAMIAGGAATRQGAGTTTVGSGRTTLPKLRLHGQGTVVADGDVITVSEAAHVVKLEDPTSVAEKLSREASQRAGSNAGLLLVVILVWIILVGIPAAELALPQEAQTVINGEIGTISLAVALTLILNQGRR